MRQLDSLVWVKIFQDLDYQSLCHFAMASQETKMIFRKNVPLSAIEKRMEWSRELSSLGAEACEILQKTIGRKIADVAPVTQSRVRAILIPIFLGALCFSILCGVPTYFFRMLPIMLQVVTLDREFNFEFFIGILSSFIIINLAVKGFVYSARKGKDILRNDQNLFYLIPALEGKINEIESSHRSFAVTKGMAANSFGMVIGLQVSPIFFRYNNGAEELDPKLSKLLTASKKQVKKWKNPDGFFFHRKLLHGENPKFSNDLEARLNSALLEALSKLT